MALVLADRVRQTTTTTGQGTITLNGTVTGFQSFSAIGDGNTTYYAIVGQNSSEWEVGIGTYTSSGTTLSRDTVLSSSAGGTTKTTFSAGTKDVFVTYPASKSVEYEATGGVVITDASTNNALRITQTGTGNALVVEDSTNPDSTPFVIDASGRAIVGHTSALSVVDTSGLSRTPNLQVQGLGGSLSAAYLGSWTNSDIQPSQIIFGKSKSGTVGTNGVVAAGTDIGAVVFSADDGSALIPAASILAEVDGTPGTNDMPGRLVFSTTADGAATPTERMRIDSSGNVGVGSSSLTAYRFRIGGNITGSTTAYGISPDVTVSSDVTSTAIGFHTNIATQAATFTLANLRHYSARQSTIGLNSTVTNQFGYYVDSTITGATNNYGFYSNIPAGTGDWNFYANGTADNYFAGDVGIGTNSPAYPLQVSTASETNIAITGGTSSETNIFFGDSGSATIGRITYNNNGDYMRFNTNGTEQVRIDSSGNLQFNSGYGSVATAYGCRAWVNFNGTGTVAIRASGNVSSITDGGTGNYTVNFTTAMPDVNYATVGSVWNTVDNGSTTQYPTARVAGIDIKGVSGIATGSVSVITKATATEASAGNVIDFSGVFVSVFR